MMIEKRFTVDDDGIYDNQEKKHFKFVAYDWIDCDIYECCEMLNEQQATIHELRNENILLKNHIEDLRGSLIIQNELLQRQMQKSDLDE